MKTITHTVRALTILGSIASITYGHAAGFQHEHEQTNTMIPPEHMMGLGAPIVSLHDIRDRVFDNIGADDACEINADGRTWTLQNPERFSAYKVENYVQHGDGAPIREEFALSWGTLPDIQMEALSVNPVLNVDGIWEIRAQYLAEGTCQRLVHHNGIAPMIQFSIPFTLVHTDPLPGELVAAPVAAYGDDFMPVQRIVALNVDAVLSDLRQDSDNWSYYTNQRLNGYSKETSAIVTLQQMGIINPQEAEGFDTIRDVLNMRYDEIYAAPVGALAPAFEDVLGIIAPAAMPIVPFNVADILQALNPESEHWNYYANERWNGFSEQLVVEQTLKRMGYPSPASNPSFDEIVAELNDQFNRIYG